MRINVSIYLDKQLAHSCFTFERPPRIDQSQIILYYITHITIYLFYHHLLLILNFHKTSYYYKHISEIRIVQIKVGKQNFKI